MEPGTLARVLHDFFTTVDGELSLPEGYYFLIHEIIDKYWCFGQSHDMVGKFPLSHLHKIEIPQFGETERLFVAIANFPGQETGDLSFAQGELIIGIRDIGSGWCMGRTSSKNGIFPITHTWELDSTLIKKPMKKKTIRKRAKVKTTLKAQLDEELDLIAGETVIVTEILEDGWCRGSTENGRIGIFPEGFISYINEDEDTADQEEVACITENNLTSLTSHNDLIYKNLDETSVNSYMNLPDEPAPSYFDLFPEALSSIDEAKDTQCNTYTNTVDIKPYATTLYPFNAQFPNELSFGVGEVVHLIKRIDSEWMEGTIDATKGIFPSSYVNIIVDCAETNQNQIQSEVISTKKDALEPDVTVRVLFTFDAQMDGDLNVHEGEIVTVVEMANEDWVNVKNKSGLIGLCPREYLSSAFEHSLDNLQESKLEEFEDFVLIRHKETSTVTNEEQKPKRLSQPHRPAPPTPAPGRVPLQKESVANREVATQEGRSQENESVISNVVDVRQKRIDQRQNVISELVMTEKEYVRDLKLTYETFNLYNPSFLESKSIDVTTLFGNILEVIHVAEELLDMIQKAMKGCDESLQTIGPCFVKMADKLKSVYVKYCGNHEAALTLLKKYENNEEIMKVFNKGIETLRLQVACFDMSSILIKPVQRILKYPLMLYELIKCTEDNHPDKAAIEEAWKVMTNVASYINEYKRRRDIVSKYLDNDNTLIGKMSKLSMHSVAKMSTRLSARLSASLGLANIASDTEFEELEKQFRSIEKCSWQLAKDIELCTAYLSDEAMSGEVIAKILVHYYQETPTADVKKLEDIRSLIWTQYIQNFKSCIEKKVSAPLHFLTTLLEGPAVLVAKRHDKLLDYDAAISKSEKYKESKIVQEELFTAKSNYEALNQQLLEELPILLDAATNILVNCISTFAGARKLLSGRITKEYLSLCETSPYLSSQDVLESFLVNHNLVWNQITRFTFAGANPQIVGGQVQLYMQTEKQRSLLREKYTVDKLYVVIEDVVSTSPLDVSTARGTLIAVIKKQDPMGDPARWYVDTGETQGFLPSQKLKPTQRQSQYHDQTTSNIAVTGGKNSSPPNLMSLDSPEKEIKKVSQSHLQDLLSLDQETKIDRNYSNIMETTRVHTYQNVHDEFYYAMYDFAGNIPGTLPITDGQVLRLLRPHDEKGNNEWWLVENRDGKQGYVPRNYLSSPIKSNA